MTVVLVCGGRDFADKEFLYRELDRDHAEFKFTKLIHGGARGADSLAGEWAKDRDIPVQVFPANWDAHGKAAGYIRNKQMLTEGKPDLVVSFEGGKGTANMMTLALDAGVQLIICVSS